MGTRFDEKYAKEHFPKPGPGNYNTNSGLLLTKKEAPGFGFGSSKRQLAGIPKHETPAPGAYTLPSKVAEVPSYVTRGFVSLTAGTTTPTKFI